MLDVCCLNSLCVNLNETVTIGQSFSWYNESLCFIFQFAFQIQKISSLKPPYILILVSLSIHVQICACSLAKIKYHNFSLYYIKIYMYHCEEYQVISFNVMQMFNKMFIPSLNFILHDYLWRIHFPQKTFLWIYRYMYFQRNVK